MSKTPLVDKITKIGVDRDMDEVALIELAEKLERALSFARGVIVHEFGESHENTREIDRILAPNSPQDWHNID